MMHAAVSNISLTIARMWPKIISLCSKRKGEEKEKKKNNTTGNKETHCQPFLECVRRNLARIERRSMTRWSSA